MQNLRTIRAKVSLTQEALAELANTMLPSLPPFAITQQYVADLETGRNANPNTLASLRIAAALGVSPSDLYGTITPTDAPAAVAA